MRTPKYRLHKATGRAVVQWAPLFGRKRKYLPGPYGSPESREAYRQVLLAVKKQRAKDELAELESGEREPAPRRRGTASVATMLLAYLDWAKDYYGPQNAQYVHLRSAAIVLKEKHAATPLADFGPLALKAVRRAMVAKGWSRPHVNQQVQRVRRMFRWAVENEMCDGSVVVNLDAVAGLRAGHTTAREPEPVLPVAWSHVAAVLPFLSPTVAAMVRVHWLCGMRSSEVCRLRMLDVDRAGDVWVYRPALHKTAHRGKRKVICLGPRAQELLTPFLPADPAGVVFSPRRAVAEQAAARRQGKAAKATKSRKIAAQYTAHSYQVSIKHGFKKLCKASEAAQDKAPPGAAGRRKLPKLKPWMEELGLVYWHPHQLRHSRATDTRAVFGIEGAQAQLGNSMEATEIYAERSIELAMRIARETG